MAQETLTTTKYTFVYFIFQIFTMNVGYYIHKSVIWAIIDFIFAPLAWIKWIIFQEVNMTIIENSLAWFLK